MDVALNSYSIPGEFGECASKITITLDEFEKSVFLTKAQDEIFLNLYSGKNVYGDYFESTEEMRRALDNLVVTKVYNSPLNNPEQVAIVNTDTEEEPTYIDVDRPVLTNLSKLYRLPADIAFITLEQVEYTDTDTCKDGFKAKVYPIAQDEYDRVKDNPFRGPTKYKVLRLDWGARIVELIPAEGFTIGKYFIKYLKKPTPIILIDLPDGLKIHNESSKSECEMDEIVHNLILDRAVALAYQSKSIGINNTKRE